MKLRTFIRSAARSRVRPRTAALIGFGVAEFATLTTTIYLHRQLAHKSLELSPGAEKFCDLVIRCSTGMDPREWAAVHQQHHAHTDEIGDPHSPLLTSLRQVQIGNVGLYKEAALTDRVKQRFATLKPDPYADVAILQRGRGLIWGIALAVLVFGPIPGTIISLVHWPSYIMLSASINSLGHAALPDEAIERQGAISHVIYQIGKLFGNRRHDTPDTSLNIPLWAFFTSGEGLHNNHHFAPSSANFALEKGEHDPGWWVISLLVRNNLATLRQPIAVDAAA